MLLNRTPMDEDDQLMKPPRIKRPYIEVNDEEANKSHISSPQYRDAAHQRHQEPDYYQDEAIKKTWPRPEARPMNPRSDDFNFQWIEMEDVVESADAQGNSTLLARLFGLTREGNDVCLNIRGYRPTLFVPVPASRILLACTNAQKEKDLCDKVARTMDDLLNSRRPRYNKHNNKQQKRKDYVEHSSYTQADDEEDGELDEYNKTHPSERRVFSVTIVQRESIWMYQGNDHRLPFFCITLNSPKDVTMTRDLIESGQVSYPGIGHRNLQTYASDVNPQLKFLIDLDLMGVAWLSLESGKWKHTAGHARASRCQYEIDCHFKDIISRPIEGAWTTTAPYRILSFDIECMGRPNVFPEAEHDPIIQIANIMQVHGGGSNTEVIHNIFVVGTCTAISGEDVRSFATEADMLLAWADFVIACDPDIFTGYNIVNFDIPYIMNRADTIGIGNKIRRISRLKDVPVRMQDVFFHSKAYGKKESKEIIMPGRCMFDMLHYLQKELKLRSYTLNSASAVLLGEQKEDVHHSLISVLQRGTPADRRRLAVYCLKDARLPLMLMNKLLAFYTYIEIARVAGIPVSWLLLKGQSIKVLSQLYRFSNKEGLLIPHVPRPPQPEGGGDSDKGSKGYEGATVIPPSRGYYDVPIVTLDFASLYPSIMMAHNLCYSTLSTKEYCETNLQPDQYVKTPCGAYFVKASVKAGVLPRILQQLLARRGVAKKEMAQTKDPNEASALNARQLALKISANSVYGFTGATLGKLPCLEVSASVTGFGREMIDVVQKFIEDHYTVANGFKADAKVIYGDTDSVMIKFGVDTVAEAMALGREAAVLVSALFIKQISMEFEKIYYPYLLISKKRYAGMFWTKETKWDKMDCKGLESVRRDNCLIVKVAVERCLEAMLVRRDVQSAVAYVHQLLRSLNMNETDLSLLVISKAFTKKPEDYAGPQCHMTVHEKKKSRNNGMGYSLGDRIPYVITAGDAKKQTTSARAEDPVFVLENNVPLDTDFYINAQLRKPLLRLFKHVLPNAERQLFEGEHMRTKYKPSPIVGHGAKGIFASMRRIEKCIACQASLTNDVDALCDVCAYSSAQHVIQAERKRREREVAFSRFWTHCQSCQGSFHQEVICSASECAIFYARTKAAVDLKRATTTVDRLYRQFDF